MENVLYNSDFQEFIIQFFLSCHDSFARSVSIVKPEYFSGLNKKIIKYLIEYSENYKTLPLFEDVNARFEKNFKKIENISERDIEAFLSCLEQYCRHKAIENIILESPDYLKNQNYGELEKKIKDALLISLYNDLGTDYFYSPKERILKLRERNNTVSTGWKSVDKKLFGGLNRGEITLFAGNSGVGKSLFLQNITLNFLKQKLNVVYITCELSELLTSMRIDAMLTGLSTKEVFKRPDDVELSVKLAAKEYGKLQIKYLPPGTTSNNIKSYLKEFEIKSGIKPDVLIVDYLDLLYPNSKKINPSDLFIKDKFVTEELRSLSVEFSLICVSASQLNRSAINEIDHDQSMIAGGISKINTCDNVITIYSSDSMKKIGEYQLKFIKTRSSSGVGSTVILNFDVNCLRITDKEEELEIDETIKKDAKKRVMLNNIKRNNENIVDIKNIDKSDLSGTNDIIDDEKKVDSLKNLINKVITKKSQT
ncbi:MAG: hypothetical protein NZZ41_04060 [Candidatus Dojkabacteria bacterium]|nr:hypothetical protein [Candidatus Dojkabacteria bacterium]